MLLHNDVMSLNNNMAPSQLLLLSTINHSFTDFCPLVHVGLSEPCAKKLKILHA